MPYLSTQFISAFTKILTGSIFSTSFVLSVLALPARAQILSEAQVGIKIPLTQKPSSRPMSVAFVPMYQRYYVADGGLGPVPGGDGDVIFKIKSAYF